MQSITSHLSCTNSKSTVRRRLTIVKMSTPVWRICHRWSTWAIDMLILNILEYNNNKPRKRKPIPVVRTLLSSPPLFTIFLYSFFLRWSRCFSFQTNSSTRRMWLGKTPDPFINTLYAPTPSSSYIVAGHRVFCVSTKICRECCIASARNIEGYIQANTVLFCCHIISNNHWQTIVSGLARWG